MQTTYGGDKQKSLMGNYCKIRRVLYKFKSMYEITREGYQMLNTNFNWNSFKQKWHTAKINTFESEPFNMMS